MKKIVVVVGDETIVFTGTNIDAIDTSDKFDHSPVVSKLIIRNDKKANIAVFKKWDYWREVDEKEDENSIMGNKVLIRPKRPMTTKAVTDLLKIMRESNIMVVSSDFQIITIDRIGRTKIL